MSELEFGNSPKPAFGGIPHADSAGPRWERSGPNYRQWSSTMGARWQHAVRCMHCGGLKKSPGRTA
jgi:hypothetical protein